MIIEPSGRNLNGISSSSSNNMVYKFVFDYIYYINLNFHTIQCRTRQTAAEQNIQEEHTKYSKILI